MGKRLQRGDPEWPLKNPRFNAQYIEMISPSMLLLRNSKVENSTREWIDRIDIRVDLKPDLGDDVRSFQAVFEARGNPNRTSSVEITDTWIMEGRPGTAWVIKNPAKPFYSGFESIHFFRGPFELGTLPSSGVEKLIGNDDVGAMGTSQGPLGPLYVLLGKQEDVHAFFTLGDLLFKHDPNNKSYADLFFSALWKLASRRVVTDYPAEWRSWGRDDCQEGFRGIRGQWILDSRESKPTL